MSTGTCSSINSAPNDKEVGLDSLPPEGWWMVLKNLETAKDRYNCAMTCPLFGDLLEDSKKLWGFELILPKILPQLDLESVLNCRLVCNDWKNGVNKFLENTPQNRPYNEEEHHRHPLLNVKPRDPLWNLVKPLDLWSIESIRSLHQEMQTNPKCRFVGKQFIVGCRTIEDADEDETVTGQRYWKSFYFFSETFGPQIFSIRLQDRWTDFSRADMQYMHVLMILDNCPNLRKLHLDFYREPRNGWDADERTTLVSFFPKKFPLPDMPHLESMVLRNAIWTPLKLALLEKYSEQLKWLKCTLSPSIPDSILRKMKVIRELAVRINEVSNNRTTSDEILQKLLLIPSCQLENLVVQMGEPDVDESGLSFSLGTMLDVCGKFPIKILRMGGAIDLQLQDSELPMQLRKRRPALKSLEFFDTAGVKSFNFLECFPSLEELYLKGSYPVPIPPPQPLAGVFAAFLGRGQQQQQQPRKLGVNQTVEEKLKLRETLYKAMDDNSVIYKSTVWKNLRHLRKIDFRYHWLNYNSRSMEESSGGKTFTRKGFWKMTGF